MRQNNKVEFTDSEMKLTEELIQNCFDPEIGQTEINIIMRFQFTPHNLKPVPDGDHAFLYPTDPPPRIDIVILPLKLGIRVNGLIHKTQKRIIKDEDQKLVLEGNGWTIMDVNYDDREDLWQ